MVAAGNLVRERPDADPRPGLVDVCRLIGSHNAGRSFSADAVCSGKPTGVQRSCIIPVSILIILA